MGYFATRETRQKKKVKSAQYDRFSKDFLRKLFLLPYSF
jgi:hypothetical protein